MGKSGAGPGVRGSSQRKRHWVRWLGLLRIAAAANVHAAPAIPRRVEAPQRYHFPAVAWHTDSQTLGPYGGPYCDSGSAVADTPWEACERAIPLLNEAGKCNPCGLVVCGPPYLPASVTGLVELNHGGGLLVRRFPPYTLWHYTTGGIEHGTSNPVRGPTANYFTRSTLAPSVRQGQSGRKTHTGLPLTVRASHSTVPLAAR